MLLPRRLQLPQVPDSSTAAGDSIAGSLDRLSAGVTDTGRLILEGQWGAVWELFLEGTAGTVAHFTPRLASALFVGLIFYGLYRVLMQLVQGVLGRTTRIDRGLETLGMKALRGLGRGFIALLVLSQLGINLSALFAGLGIAGLAIGFAAKDSLENFISGLTILLDRPFTIGDWITVSGHFGRVTNITLRSTRLRTLNAETVIFPSVDMVTNPITNHSAGSPLRVVVPFGIAYKEDIDTARSTVMDAIGDLDDRFAHGDPSVITTGLGDSSIGMELRVFVKDPANAVTLKATLTERIKKALDNADIEIPFPHLQLHIDGAHGLRGIGLSATASEAS